MSPQDLLQSGVIGLDEEISSLPVSPLSQLLSSDSETETSEIRENRSGSRGSVTESLTRVDVQQKGDRSDILQSLQVLEEQILEERLKLEALRLCESGEILSEPSLRSNITTHSSCRERRMFLEEEKQDVAKMERSLRRERVKKRVVRCSIMEKNSMTEDLSSSDAEEKLHYTHTPRLTEMNTSQTPQDEEQECTEVTNKSQPCLSSPASPDSTSQTEIDQDVQSRHDEFDTVSDLTQSSSTDFPSVHPLDEISSCLAERQQTNPENSAFDPGGAPVPAPRSVFNDAQVSESVSESIDLMRTPGEISRCLQGLHMHNNNNNTLVQLYLHGGHSETRQNISTVLPNTAEPHHEECVKEEREETGQPPGRVRNERGVSDGGGATRAVLASLLDQLRLNTSQRPVRTRDFCVQVECFKC